MVPIPAAVFPDKNLSELRDRCRKKSRETTVRFSISKGTELRSGSKLILPPKLKTKQTKKVTIPHGFTIKIPLKLFAGFYFKKMFSPFM